MFEERYNETSNGIISINPVEFINTYYSNAWGDMVQPSMYGYSYYINETTYKATVNSTVVSVGMNDSNKTVPVIVQKPIQTSSSLNGISIIATIVVTMGAIGMGYGSWKIMRSK